MSSSGDADSQIPTIKDEGDEKLDSVEEVGTMPSGSLFFFFFFFLTKNSKF